MGDETDSPTTRATIANATGDAHFSAQKYQAAIKNYTDAIQILPDDYVYYLNRSKARAALGEFKESLSDANSALALKPDSPDGFLRRGAAHCGLRQFKEAVLAYEDGLKAVSAYTELKCGLELAQAHVAKLDSMWLKLRSDGETSHYVSDPRFEDMMTTFFQSPCSLYLHNRKFIRALGVLSDAVKIQPNGRAGVFGDALLMGVEGEWASKEEQVKERREIAKKFKSDGTVAYKQKNLQGAIDLYSKALELEDEDISILTNRAAAFLETGKYHECIKDCDKALERGKELRSDSKMVARALSRKGTALAKIAKLPADFEAAIKCYEDSLSEHYDSETAKKLQQAHGAMRELAEKDSFKGNEYLKEQQLKLGLPNDLVIKIAQSSSVLKLSAVCSVLSKDIHKGILSIKDLKLVGDTPGTEAEMNFLFPTEVGIIKCVGRYDTKKFQPLFDLDLSNKGLVESDPKYKPLLLLSELLLAFNNASSLSLESFDKFKNLESISLTFPCFHHHMNDSMGYFWKRFFLGGMNSFFFIVPQRVLLEDVEIINTDVRLRPQVTVAQNLFSWADDCFCDVQFRIGFMYLLATKLSKLRKISVTGRDPIKVGNIVLEGQDLLSQVRNNEVEPVSFGRKMPSKALFFDRFEAPHSKYLFEKVYVIVSAEDKESLETPHPHIGNDTGSEGEGLEKGYIELFNYVADRLHLLHVLQERS